MSLALACFLVEAVNAQQEIKLNLKPQRPQERQQPEDQVQPLERQKAQEQAKPIEQAKLQPQQLETAYIEWKPIEGAVSYQVEITDVSRKKIIEKTTGATRLEINLPYGKYYYRVGIVTKFNKPSMWTDWLELLVVPALEPSIISATPSGIYTGLTSRITIKGKNFYRKSSVSIKSADASIAVTHVKYIDPETLLISVNTKGAKPGSYDLAVKNPGDLLNLTAMAKNQVTLTEKPPGYPLEYHLALEAGYNTSMLAEDDPYSGAFGFNFFCEFHSIWRSHEKLAFLSKAPGLYPGLVFSYFGFLKPGEGFGASMMLQAGLFFGYQFTFPIKGEWKLNVSPVLGFKQYFRWHRFDGMDSYGTRPILFFGGNVTVDLPKNFFIGIAVEYDAIFELKPVHTMGFFIRCGYRL